MDSNRRSAIPSFGHGVSKDLDSMDQGVAELVDPTQISLLQRAGPQRLDHSLGIMQDFPEEERKRLSSLERMLENSRQNAVNLYSRPQLRPRTILDIPDEILIKVAGYVKDWEFASGVCEIKNLRITCRRFCSVSSHLLIHFVRVELNTSSLLRFEEIIRHPAISKGVRTVRVLLHFYGSVLASDIRVFAEYNKSKLVNRSGDFKGEINLEAVEKCWAIVKSWEGFVRGAPDDPTREDDLSHRILLRRAYEDYRERFLDQERLREDGTFVRAIAVAIATTPTVKSLEIHDQDASVRMRDHLGQAENSEALVHNLLLPIQWEEARLLTFGHPPAEILVKIPGAIHNAGGLLNGLNIEVSPLEHYSVLAPSQEDRRDLIAAVQRLKTLEFNPKGIIPSSYWDIIDPGSVENLGRFLNALLDTESIERLCLDFSYVCDRKNPPLVSLGSIIALRPWKNLSYIFWSTVSIHLAELERFIDQLGKPIMFITIKYMHLLSGSWADGLDILRRKSTACTRFEDPLGAECEVLSDEDKRAVFAKSMADIYDTSKAERYIRGYTSHNPLRVSTEN